MHLWSLKLPYRHRRRGAVIRAPSTLRHTGAMLRENTYHVRMTGDSRQTPRVDRRLALGAPASRANCGVAVSDDPSSLLSPPLSRHFPTIMSAQFTFRKAVRSAAKLKIGIAGPSGSGKTIGALKLARQLVGPAGRIAMIDTENESASLYADEEEFETLNLTPDFTTERYMAAVKVAVDAEFDVLVIDSVSHEWEGPGGILDRKQREESSATGKVNGFQLWNKYKGEHRKFVDYVLRAPIHIICCMRSRQEHAQDGNKVVKLGMAPITGEGFEYELSVVFDLGMNHEATVSKDRTQLFDGRMVNLVKDAPGAALAAWLTTATAVERPDTDTLMRIHAAVDAMPDAKQPAARQKLADMLHRGLPEGEARGVLAKLTMSLVRDETDAIA